MERWFRRRPVPPPPIAGRPILSPLSAKRCGPDLPLLAIFSAGCFTRSRTPTTLRMDVKLVNVFVNVTDPNGAIVGGLTQATISPSPKMDGRRKSLFRAPVGGAAEP